MNIKPSTIANDKSHASILNFTSDQQRAYDTLLTWINSPYNPSDYKRALVGAAGTGKTYLLRAIIDNCSMSYSTIGLSAPTHKACRVLKESINISNIKVNTLQSDLGFRLNVDLDNFDVNNPPFDPKGKIKIGNYQLYIVDEASMINRNTLLILEKIVKQNKCKLIYVGDDSQLPPVKESFSPAFKGIKSSILTQIVRQGDNNPVTPLLEILRYDIQHKTFRFLEYISKNRYEFNDDNTKGYKVCNLDEFDKLVYINFNDQQLTKNIDYSKIIAYTNSVVSSWNKIVRNTVVEDSDKSVLTKNDLIISYITIVNQFNDIVITNSEEYIVHDIVNYVNTKFNLDGFLVKFQAIHGGKISTPLFVLNHNDINNVAKYVTQYNTLLKQAIDAPKTIKGQKWTDFYSFKENCLLLTNIIDKQGKLIVGRNLDYGFSLTAHKSQGSTFDTTFVDVDDIVFDKLGRIYVNAEDINRRLYVACSRCKNKLYMKWSK